MPVLYACNKHGDIDALKAWACPECMREARHEIRRLGDEVNKRVEQVARLTCDVTHYRALYYQALNALKKD